MRTRYKYKPDYAVHPGETLREKLDELEMSPKTFAIRTGKPVKTISEILNAKSSITFEMSILFEAVLKIPANFWIKKQANYNEFVVREKHQKELEQAVDWAKHFPYSQIAKMGLVKTTRKAEEKVEELLHFFDVSKPSAWENIYLNQQTPVYFRISLKHSKDPYALSTLLRMGEMKAEAMKAPEFQKARLRSLLPDLKSIMTEKPEDYLKQIQEKCLLAGVKVVYTLNLPKTVNHGAVRWINGKPVLQMTDRLKKYDIFWFSLFHEIGHILLHGNKKNIFLEEINKTQDNNIQEIEADKFAENIVLPEKDYRIIENNMLTERNKEKVADYYAKKLGTHRDIIIGRFLKENKGQEYQYLYATIQRVDFQELK